MSEDSKFVPETSEISMKGHLTMLAAIRNNALKAGNYSMAIEAEVARAHAASLYGGELQKDDIEEA